MLWRRGKGKSKSCDGVCIDRWKRVSLLPVPSIYICRSDLMNPTAHSPWHTDFHPYQSSGIPPKPCTALPFFAPVSRLPRSRMHLAIVLEPCQSRQPRALRFTAVLSGRISEKSLKRILKKKVAL